MLNSSQIMMRIIVSENPAGTLAALDHRYLDNRETFLNLFLAWKTPGPGCSKLG